MDLFYDKFLARIVDVISSDKAINPKCVVPGVVGIGERSLKEGHGARSSLQWCQGCEHGARKFRMAPAILQNSGSSMRMVPRMSAGEGHGDVAPAALPTLAPIHLFLQAPV